MNGRGELGIILEIGQQMTRTGIGVVDVGQHAFVTQKLLTSEAEDHLLPVSVHGAILKHIDLGDYLDPQHLPRVQSGLQRGLKLFTPQ